MEKYYIEWNGEIWQSVFKTPEAEKSQLHTTLDDAFAYMRDECGVTEDIIITGKVS